MSSGLTIFFHLSPNGNRDRYLVLREYLKRAALFGFARKSHTHKGISANTHTIIRACKNSYTWGLLLCFRMAGRLRRHT